MTKIVFICGQYQHAFLGNPHIQLVTQTIETGQEILERGRNFYKEVKDEPITVFSNCELFFYGIRNSIKRGDLDYRDIEIRFYPDYVAGYMEGFITVTINAEGRVDLWPKGFFDAYDAALDVMLD